MMGTSIYLARSFENTNLLERDQSTKAFEAARDLINATYRNNIPSQADMPSSQWVGEYRTDDKKILSPVPENPEPALFPKATYVLS